jgi:hypothetical protein
LTSERFKTAQWSGAGPDWWERPVDTPGVRPRRAVLVMLLGLLLPMLLAFDRIAGPFASPQSPYFGLVDRRVREYARTIGEPKIVIVGGSNVLFGLWPRQIERDLGVPVVSYGTNAGIGMDLAAERAAGLIGPGDLVVAMPELHHFTWPGPVDKTMRRDWIAAYRLSSPDPVGRFPQRELLALRSRCRGIVARAESWWSEGLGRTAEGKPWSPPASVRAANPYELGAIDERGLLSVSRPARRPGGFRNQSPPGQASRFDWKDSEGMVGLRTLAEVCRQRGATLAICPAIRAKRLREDEPYLRAVEEREAELIRAAGDLGAVAVLGPGQTLVPPEFAYDTTNHLNDKGVAVMTARMTEGLRAAWDRRKPAAP